MDPNGYIREYVPDHPNKNTMKTVAQHRLVMEGMIGRLLLPDEIVHHKNRRRADNRRTNLQLLDRKSHFLEHVKEFRANTIAPLTRAQVRRALKGKSTLETAAELGVSHQTLRNRFPDLLTKRTPPNGPYDAAFVKRAALLAADPTVGTRKAAALLHTTPLTLRTCCRRHGIEWIAAPVGRPSRKG